MSSSDTTTPDLTPEEIELICELIELEMEAWQG